MKIENVPTTDTTPTLEETVPVQQTTPAELTSIPSGSILSSAVIGGAKTQVSQQDIAMLPEIPKPTPVNKTWSNALREVNDEDSGVLEAAFQTDNTAVNAFNYLNSPEFKPSSTFDIREHQDKLVGLEEYNDELVSSKSLEELNYKINKIAREQTARKTISDAGWAGLGISLVAGLADPINYIPIVGQSIKAKAIVGAGIAAASEVVNQSNQITRTGYETTMNIAGTAIIVGGLTHLANKVGYSSDNLTQITNQYNQNPNVNITNIQVPQSVGAASVSNYPHWGPDDTKLTGWDVINAVGSVTSPALSVLRTESATARNTVSELVDHGFELAGHSAGKYYRPVESIRDSRISNYIGTNKKVLASEYDNLIKADPTNKLSYDEFAALALRHAFAGDVQNTFAQAASKPIAKMFNEVASELQSLNTKNNLGLSMLDDMHNPILYQTTKIRSDSVNFINDITTKLESKINGLTKAEQDEIIDVLDATDIKTASQLWAEEIKNAIVYDRSSFAKLKNSKIDTPLDKKDLADWLIQDPIELSKRYLDKNIWKIEMDNRFGTSNFNELMKPIIKEYDDLKAANPANQSKIDKELKSVEKNMRLMYDNIAKTSQFSKNQSDVIVNNIMKLAQASKLGSAVLSSLTDTAKLIQIDGITKVFSHQLKTLVDRSDINTLSREEMIELSSWLDDIQNNRTNSLAGIIDQYTEDGFITKGVNYIAEKSMKLSLLPHWTKWQKVQAGYIAADKMVTIGNKLLNNKSVSKTDLINFSKVGLDESALKKIATEYNRVGQNRLLNVGQWESNIQQRFKESLSRYVDKTINTPKAGDLPGVLKTPLGRVFFQFQSFALLNWNQFIIAGLQRPDARFLSTIGGLAGVAYLQLNLKEKLTGKQMPKEWGGMDGIAAKIVDESGILSGPTIAYDKTIGIVPGLSRDELFGTHDKAYKETPAERVLNAEGPVLGYITDAVTAISPAFTDTEYKSKNITAMRKLIPFQNNFYMRGVFNQAEMAIKDGLNIEYKPYKDVVSEYIRGK